MNRRTALVWLSKFLGAVCASVVAIPGLIYGVAKVKRRHGATSSLQRVARLADLAPGQPQEVVIMGTQHDAWTTYPQQVLGRIWVVRQTGAEIPPPKAYVAAFSSVCPHLGCRIQFATGASDFVCPCHKGVFALNGQRVASAKLGYANPAPRDMDSLACHLERDDVTQEWWVVVNYQEFITGRAERISKV